MQPSQALQEGFGRRRKSLGESGRQKNRRLPPRALLGQTPSGAAVRWAGSGRGRNGKDVTFRGIDVFALDGEGRITTLDAYWDAAPVMEDISSPA